MATTTIGRLHNSVEPVRTQHAASAKESGAVPVLALSTRALLVFTALLFVAIGVVTLTGPLAVPFTVTMWLCAASFAGLAVFWELPEG